MALEEVAAPPETACARSRLSGVVARLAAANLLGAAMGFVTGPLLARSLGAAGRGDLQAVIVPLTVASYALSLGITAYAYRTLMITAVPPRKLGLYASGGSAYPRASSSCRAARIAVGLETWCCERCDG